LAKPNVISRQDLLDSAKKIVVEQGMDKLTLKAVATGAEVTQGTVYYHFRTKENLMLELVEELCDEAWSEMEAHIHDKEQLLRTALASAKSRIEDGGLYHRLFFQLAATSLHHNEMREKLGKLFISENDHLSNLLKKHWDEPPILGVSFDSFALFANALIDGIALQCLLNEQLEVTSLFAELERFFMALSEKGGRDD